MLKGPYCRKGLAEYIRLPAENKTPILSTERRAKHRLWAVRRTNKHMQVQSTQASWCATISVVRSRRTPSRAWFVGGNKK